MENRRRWRDGREVPGAGGGNSIKWIDISVPSFYPPEGNVCIVPPSSEEDYASSIVIGEPPISFVWRINKTSSNVLNVLQLSSKSEFPSTGIRFAFAQNLYPFAFPFLAYERSGGPLAFYLYAFTPSGVVYVLNLSNALAHNSGSVLPYDQFIQVVVDVRPYLNEEAQVTCVTASPGFIFLGRSDGFISCFKPFVLPQQPGFNFELRDDTGFLRRWGLTRGTDVAAVIDLSILELLNGSYFLNVLHADGRLRIWGFLTRTKLLCDSIATDNLFVPLRLWVGNADYHSRTIPVAVLFRRNLVNMITVIFIRFTFENYISFLLDPTFRNIPLQEGELRDVRFTSDRIWILKANELISQMLPYRSSNKETQSYFLQEEYISEQLFLTPASSSHDLRLTTHSLFSSAKDRTMGFISSVYLGRLLCLGIFDDDALRLTLRDHNKHWSDSEFQSLSLDELKSEILSLIEQEVTGETTISVFQWWETFCTTYLDHWRNNNAPRTLLVQSDGIGLVRNNSVSLFFRLENAEHSLGGPSSEQSNSLGMSHNEHEILLEVLKCTLEIRKQLGGAPCAMYYESVTGEPVMSGDEILSGLVNILESDLGADRACEKELEAHENHRTFSIDMILSLSALCQRAGSWEKFFTIMEKYLQQHLVPKKFRHNNNGEPLSDICSSILVQATSQFAKVMFESAFDIVLLLSYLLNISGQVNMSQQDICKLRLNLLPMSQDIVSEWLFILFFVTTPAESTSMDDCNSSSIEKKSWNKMFGKCGFSLAYILLFSDRSCIVDSGFNLRYLPDSQVITSLVQNFVSWICYSKSGDGSASLLRRSSELTLRLIRNGQADAVERILEVVVGSLRGDWCLFQHLRGCCLLDKVQRGACGISREEEISDATRCFFSSLCEGSWKALHSFAKEAEFSHSTSGDSISDGEKSCVTRKPHYYEWAMQIFERYNISEYWRWITSVGQGPSNELNSAQIGWKLV